MDGEQRLQYHHAIVIHERPMSDSHQITGEASTNPLFTVMNKKVRRKRFRNPYNRRNRTIVDLWDLVAERYLERRTDDRTLQRVQTRV